jgi:hypothetical protein
MGEISDVNFQIGQIKAPGPDGFLFKIYQRKWKILCGDLTQVVAHFFAKRVMPEAVKDTYVVLIPKIHNRFEFKDYLPIGLCNVINKVMAKCLVNRLWLILDDIISENQSPFSPGRMITNNALLAFECMHYMEHVYFC